MTNGFGMAENGHVVRFCSAAHEIDLTPVSSDGSSHAFACLLQTRGRTASHPVRAGRITEFAIENGDHPLAHLGANRRSSRVIEVNQRHASPVSHHIRARYFPESKPLLCCTTYRMNLGQ